MKKVAFCFITACLSLTFHPLHSNANNNSLSSFSVVSKADEADKAKSLLIRLDEIYAMDKSDFKSTDKENLGMEVRSINHQLRVVGGGIYLSAGAIIIIVLLLIILL